MADLYWSVYKNLERELVGLSEVIHFDDAQLGVYSVKIADLLVRTCVEIESLAKVLYFECGGVEPENEKDLYYDTMCLGLLNDQWKLARKKVSVVHPNMYFSKPENIELTPLHKAHKRGTSGAGWARAYQAVKHNREKNLKSGNIGNFIQALAALFILNVYHRNTEFILGKHPNDFDPRLNSEIFSVKFAYSTGYFSKTDSSIKPDMEDCVYIIKGTDLTRGDLEDALRKLMSEARAETQKTFDDYVGALTQEQKGSITDEELEAKFKEIQNNTFQKIGQRLGREISAASEKVRYEAVLNKSQFDTKRDNP